MSSPALMTMPSKPRSLRSILIQWFFLFSIVPICFVAWYSVFKFEKAIDNELSLRLMSNAREVEVIVSDYYSHLQQSRESLSKNPHVLYDLSTNDGNAIRELSIDWIRNSIATSLAFYDRDGRLLSSVYRDEKNNLRSFGPNSEKILLNKNYLNHLKDKAELGLSDYSDSNQLNLILFSKVQSASNKTIGYIEQTIEIKESFLNRIKSKLKLESFLVRDNGQVIATTLPDLTVIPKNILLKALESADPSKLFEVQSPNHPYGFILYPMYWDRSHFYMAIGVSKKETQMVLSNVNLAFFSVIAVVILLLVITILVSTKWFIKPIQELIVGLKAFERTDSLVQLPIKNKTEIGLLTAAFNEMSHKIFQTRRDLKKKIKELELSNNELKEAQTKLVHSAKMTSLGQLVAGVAHELNNPIGFIYSNTSHLKDYTEKLFQIIDSEKNISPELEALKNEVDYDYIKKDLPQLIKSCQDGAQRTRDIVLGLRNFSRLEEAQLKEIDLRESLDTTLDLLKGEIKNRIQIHRQYESIPKVTCYASQINQVLMNILSNAVQAIHGSGQIWITTTALKASTQGVGKVQISVQDTGEGMAPEVLEKIFEPFFTTKGVGQGTGLGLSISYGIMQNHGGEIQVRSEKGVGTEFILIIPVTPTPIK